MRKIFTKLVCGLLCAFVSVSLFACDEEPINSGNTPPQETPSVDTNRVTEDGFTYEKVGESYTVIDYMGRIEEMIVPVSFQGLPVTAIGDEAFSDSYFSSVIIPEGILHIGNFAFKSCLRLNKASIPNSVKSIGESVFEECSWLEYNQDGNGKYLGNEENPYLYLAGVLSKTISDINIIANC